jgi:DNA polymerase III subunit chi
MTEVAFHLNVADVGSYTCRLLRKAYFKGARVQVLAESAQIDALDRELWLMGQGEFVPHATSASPSRVLQRSAIVLGGERAEGAEVLVNLSVRMPEDIHTFGRVIEVVGASETDRQQARQRWKTYRDVGLNPVAIDLSASREA